MDIKDLTAEMDKLVAAKGWYAPDSPRPQLARSLAISLSLEAAEVLEHFQWREQPAKPGDLPGELADVALYLLQLARVLGIDLEQAVLDKIRVNYTRTWDQPEDNPA
jgi:NTP pyrophosphatase (non-canonical NTP hydrolase)